eukprot:2157418-Rhodomonas_salina.2
MSGPTNPTVGHGARATRESLGLSLLRLLVSMPSLFLVLVVGALSDLSNVALHNSPTRHSV